jgi:hypothetical protein
MGVRIGSGLDFYSILVKAKCGTGHLDKSPFHVTPLLRILKKKNILKPMTLHYETYTQNKTLELPKYLKLRLDKLKCIGLSDNTITH